MGDYDTVMKKAMTAMFSEEELDERYGEISFAKVQEELEKRKSTAIFSLTRTPRRNTEQEAHVSLSGR